MDVSLMQFDGERRAPGDVLGGLGRFENQVIELDDIADMKAGGGGAKNEKDVVTALRIAVVKFRVQFLNADAHRSVTQRRRRWPKSSSTLHA